MVNVDGRLAGERDAVVSVFDHGFLFGEGVYEVMRTYRQRPFLYEPHMRRLRASADRIALPLPTSDAEIRERIGATIAAAQLPAEAYIRLLVTRGVGEIGYDPANCPAPTVVIIVKPHVELPREAYTEGVKIALVSVLRNHPESVNPLIKSNNLLNNALAMQEALKRGAAEALMKNHRGELAECAMSNIFLVSGGAEDQPERWKALNHLAVVNKLLGYENRVAMTNRKQHSPDAESNEALYTFFEWALKAK